MTDKPQEPTQKTLKGLEIPVPKRESIFDAFRMVIKPVKNPTDAP